MTDAVVDTNVLSYIVKGHSLARPYQELILGYRVLISFMTEAELIRWSLVHDWSTTRREGLVTFMNAFSTIQPNRDLCVFWARAMTEARRRGRRMETADAWIAATAHLHDAPLITHNPTDFVGLPGPRVITLAGN